MTQATTTLFRRSAIAGGLVTAEQLAEAEAAVRAAHPERDSATAVPDEQLAAKLIELTYINLWQAEQLKVGRTKFTLGPYRVIDSIGQGGMGQVFKAEHTMMGRVVAIKVLPRHKSTPEAIAAFNREIRAQAQLDHEHLVRAFDAGHDGNVYFLVTEYVPGTDLRKFVRARGKLSMHDAATIITHAARALAYAHGRGLIHRDVKPGNLLVTADGRTKLSDLGLAGFLGNEVEGDPRAGKIVGTADYLAPENILFPGTVSPACDVYSLGCTLYYAVSGKVPFPGGSTRDKIRRHCETAPLNPRRFNSDLSEPFLDVLAAMMEKDPRKRIQSADEVAAKLSRWAGQSVSTTLQEQGSTSSQSLAQAARPSGQPKVGDTEPNLFGAGQGEESYSQLSQGTVPIRGAGQDTLPMLYREPAVNRPVELSLVAMFLLALPLMAAAVLIGSMVLKALR